MSIDYQDRMKKLQELIDVQGDDGNWNNSPYMHGMLNGMIFSLSMFTDEEPDYRDAPEIFSCEAELLEKFNNSKIVIKE